MALIPNWVAGRGLAIGCIFLLAVVNGSGALAQSAGNHKPPQPGSQKPPQSAKSKVSPQFERIAEQATKAREANRTDEAIDLYQKALKLNPRWGEGWWYLGTLYYDGD